MLKISFFSPKIRGWNTASNLKYITNSTFATTVLAAREPVFSNLTDLIASPFVKTTTVEVSRPAARIASKSAVTRRSPAATFVLQQHEL